MRFLLVEDDALLGDGLRAGLQQSAFAVDWVRDGPSAEEALRTNPYAAAVLDLSLPGKDGLLVLASVRKAGVKLPVLVLTARDAIDDRVRGLDLGADDYVVKPVDLLELAARLRALVRRSHGQPVVLSVREFDLLHTFMLHMGRVLSREQLEQQLYSWGQEVESNTVEVHVHRLRRKLGSTLIQTVRGVGYVLMRPPGQA